MRTIGKRNIKLVKTLTRQEMKKANGLGSPFYEGVDDNVMEQLPESLFDLWEGAFTEITNIINDTIMEEENERGV